MVPSCVITVIVDGERLTCSGFSLGKTIRLGRFEFIADLARFEFESGTVSFCFSFLFFSFLFVSFGESCLLVSWCTGGRCGMTCSEEDPDRSRRPGAEDRGWSHRSDTRWSDDREVGWRRVRSAPCMWR
jgi:hypothetical protein